MKKWISIMFILGTIFLAGCTKTVPSTISFDTFSTTIKSPYQYQQTKISTDTEEIQKIYTSTNSGLQSSIIIANQAVLSGDSISFANENLKILRSNLEWKGVITNTKSISLSCGDEDVPASISTIEVQKNTTTRYVSQLYFVYQHKWYIISHLTENKDEVKWIQKWLANISCPKN